MKRFLSLLLVFAVLLSLPFSVFAVESLDNPFSASVQNVLDVSSPNGENSRYVNFASLPSTVTFDLPEFAFYDSVRLVLNTIGWTPSVVINGNVGVVSEISPGTYVVVCRIPNACKKFEVAISGANRGWVIFNAFDAFYRGTNPVKLSGHTVLKDAIGTQDVPFGNVLYYRSGSDVSVAYRAEFYSYLSSNWVNFDFVDLYFDTYVYSLDSISPYLGSVSIPYTIDYFKGGANDRFSFRMRLDLRGLPKNTGQNPCVRVNAKLNPKELKDPSFFNLASATAFTVIKSPDAHLVWYERIYKALLQLGDWMNSGFQRVVNAIEALPDKIAEAMSKVFKPDDAVIDQTVNDVQGQAQDSLGGFMEGAQAVDKIVGALKPPAAATSTVNFPAVTVNLAGVDFTFGGWDVQIIPPGFDVLTSACRLIINAICTLGFLNALKKRLEGLFR